MRRKPIPRKLKQEKSVGSDEENVLLEMPAEVRANLVAQVRVTMQISAGAITEQEARPELERLKAEYDRLCSLTLPWPIKKIKD